ncbi:hypothetical protein [Marinitenerispora sediminis]|nr:hypothetical protein [Marinitenerispora sediminis]
MSSPRERPTPLVKAITSGGVAVLMGVVDGDRTPSPRAPARDEEGNG